MNRIIIECLQQDMKETFYEVIQEKTTQRGIHLGVTGGRRGTNQAQRENLICILDMFPNILMAEHGDCVGVDEEFHQLCQERQIPICIHPPSVNEYRAFCEGASKEQKAKAFLTRNKNIAASVDVLIAIPWQKQEKQRSGIWATVRYARKAQKSVILLMPEGNVVFEVGSLD